MCVGAGGGGGGVSNMTFFTVCENVQIIAKGGGRRGGGGGGSLLNFTERLFLLRSNVFIQETPSVQQHASLMTVHLHARKCNHEQENFADRTTETCLSRPSCSSNLAPCDFVLLPFLKQFHWAKIQLRIVPRISL